MSRWIEAVSVSAFDNLHPDRQSVAVDVEGYDLVVFKLSEGWGALDDTCSHEFSKLSEGEIWNDRVYCEKHGSSFDCKSGKVKGLPATDDVPAFKAEERGDSVWIELPDYS